MAPTSTLPHERELESTLQRERESLRQSLAWIESAEQLRQEGQADQSQSIGAKADIASDMTEDTLDATLESIERNRLAQVEEALRKMAGHGYGLCERCGQPIEIARLIALPWTRQCIRCSHLARNDRGRSDA